MAWTPHYCVLLFCSLAYWCNEALPFQEFGVVTVSNGTFKFVGDSLELYCNITDTTLRDNSSMLHFERATKKEKGVILKKYIEILTTKTIRLRLPQIDLDDEGVYDCFQKKFSGGTRVIGSQIIKVDNKPVMVKDIHCIVDNWEQMNCTWDLGVKFQHPEFIKVYLVWTVDGTQHDCRNLTNTSCLWTPDDYIHGHQYLMAVMVSTVVNGTVLVTERSSQFRIETMLYATSGIVTVKPTKYNYTSSFAAVKPAPADNFQAKAVNSTCVELTWQHKNTDRDKYFIGEFRLVGTTEWIEILLNQYGTKSDSSLVCSLIPYKIYDFRISVLPFPVDTKEPVKSQGYRSDMRMATAQTLEDVPMVGPKICSGCFYEFKCPQNDSNRCIKLYWQDLKEHEKRGILTNYTITFTSSEADLKPFVLPVVTSANLELPKINHIFVMSICPATSQGYSKKSSAFYLPPFQKKPDPPPNFLVETEKINDRKNITFYMSWAALNFDAKTGQNITHITIVWCLGNGNKLLCLDELHWVQLSADHVTYELKVEANGHLPSDFLIGITTEVSSDGQTVSSGIHWSTCIYHRNESPRDPVKDIRQATKHPLNGLTIHWDKPSCTEENSFIIEYLVKFCPVYEDGLCLEPERMQNVSNSATDVTLENLKENMSYKVTVIAASLAGLGPPVSIITKPVQGSPPGQDVAGTLGIIGGILSFVLILIILLFLFKYCRSRMKLPKARDMLTQYAETKADIQKRPLPRTPDDQHIYGLFARMNSLGFKIKNDKKCAENNSEESVTSQSSLLPSNAGVKQRSLSPVGNKPHTMKNTVSKARQNTTKEAKSLLENNFSLQFKNPRKANSSKMVKNDTNSAVNTDYCTAGYISNDTKNNTNKHLEGNNGSPQDRSQNSSSSLEANSSKMVKNDTNSAVNTDYCTAGYISNDTKNNTNKHLEGNNGSPQDRFQNSSSSLEANSSKMVKNDTNSAVNTDYCTAGYISNDTKNNTNKHLEGNNGSPQDRFQNSSSSLEANSSKMVKNDTNSAVNTDYCTAGYISNDTKNNTNKHLEGNNGSPPDRSQNSSSSLPNYHHLAANSSDYNTSNISEVSYPDFRCSNTSTLPLRRYNFEMPNNFIDGKVMSAIDPSLFSISLEHGRDDGQSQLWVCIANMPNVSKCEQECHSPKLQLGKVGETKLNMPATNFLVNGHSSEYIAHL